MTVAGHQQIANVLLLLTLHAIEGLAYLLQFVTILIDGRHVDAIVIQFLYDVDVKLRQAIFRRSIIIITRSLFLCAIFIALDLVLSLAILVANLEKITHQVVGLDQRLLVLEYFLRDLELLQLADEFPQA